MSKKVVIIGGGHNGVVCAAYLAKAGMDVTVLERRPMLGGAAVTEEFYPGFRNSVCSYTVSLLHPIVIKDLDLYRHGLKILPRSVNNFLPLPGGDSFTFIPGQIEKEIARFSEDDAASFARYESLLQAVVPVIREIMLMTPPALAEAGIGDLLALFKLSRQFKNLNKTQVQFLLTLFARSAGEILDDFFQTDPLKALLGFDAIVGNYTSPYGAGNGYNLLHHLLGEVNGKSGSWGHAVGGMGAISEAIAAEGTKYSARYHTNSSVSRVQVESGRAGKVITEAGDEYDADIVVSNVNPVLLFTQLLDKSVVSEEIHQHFKQYNCGSGSFRINLALNGLPAYEGRQVPNWMEAGIILGPSLAYMDTAWRDAKESGWSSRPVIEMLIPSLVDDSLAPEGCHVASLFCQHFDPGLGQNWDLQKEAAVASILDTLETVFPGFRQLIEGIQVLSPWDLEREFGLVNGDIFHGRLSLEQLFSARPGVGMAQYEMPIRGLYLCGSGAHPGGGVSGLPGRNAARRILG